MITIKKPSGNVEIKSPLPTKMIVSGEAMSGKTTFVGKFPTPFFLSFDGNAIKEGRDGVDLRGTFDYQDVIDAIPEIVKAGYETIVVDTIEDMLDGIELGVANGGSISDMNNSFNGWAKLNGRFKKIIKAIDNSKMISVFIARTTVDQEGKIQSDARAKNYSWLKGRIDGEIFINQDHTAEWKAHRGYWKQEELPSHLSEVADPEREGQERKQAALKRREELMKKTAEKK